MREAPVDDLRGADAALDRLDAGLELRAHTAFDLPERRPDLRDTRLVDQALRIRGVGEPAAHVGQEDRLHRAERDRDRRRRLVGVDVVGVALGVRADGGEHRDVVGRDVDDDAGIDGVDLPDPADVLSPGRAAPRAAQQAAVVAREPDRRLPVARDPQHDVGVQLADQDHLRDLDRRLVGDAQAADELDRHLEALHVGGDVRAAAVNDDRVDPDVLEQHDVARELLAQLRVVHRRAAVLDHDCRAVELADIGERFEEGCDFSAHEVYSELKWT